MKNIIGSIVLALSFTAQANLGASADGLVVSWAYSGGWMQLQDSSDYSTVCEGDLAYCTVLGSGTYQLIDHTADKRQKDIIVGGSQPSSNTVFTSGPAPQPVQTTVIVKELCMFDGYHERRACRAECPTGMTIKRVMQCMAHDAQKGGLVMPTGFTSSEITMWCYTGTVTGLTQIEAGVVCE